MKYKTDTGGLPADECPNLLVSLVQQMKKCFIVLDGLDEYVSNDTEIRYSRYPTDIFEDLFTVTKICRDQCRMLVASREDIYHLHKERIVACDIEIKAQEEDIAAYVTKCLLSRDFKFRQELQDPKGRNLREEIVETLCRNAKGL